MPTQPLSGDPPKSITTSDLFQAFPTEAHTELVSILEPIQLPAGAHLFEQGDLGDALYLVSAGRLGIYMDTDGGGEQLVDEYGVGASVGELALISGKPRTARAIALANAKLLRLSRAAFEDLAARYPEAVRRYADTLLLRLRRSQIVGVLGGLFGELAVQELNDLVSELEWRSLNSGDALFRQGDTGDYVAIVVTGRLRVEVSDGAGPPRAVAELGRGQYVGELAVITGEPRSAAAIAVRDTDLALLRKEAFDRLIVQHPTVMQRMTKVVVERLRATTRAPAPAPAAKAMSLAIVPISSGVDVAGLADGLEAALGQAGITMRLDPGRMEAALGRHGYTDDDDHPTNLILRGWLSERESDHHFMLYVADPQPSPWTLRCLRQADLIVLVGMAQATPAPSANEAAISRLGLRARQALVLIQPAGVARPVGAAGWLAPRQVEAHFHIHAGDQSDISRIARLLTGRGTGLVLSGGGARGFAHIGVLRAFHEAGIVIDTIGGVSSGALIGGAYAMGMGPREMDEMARVLVRQWRVPDFTLPLVSMVAGEKLTSNLRHVFGETQIEDLWRSFFCLSVNLSRLKMHVHRSGSLWRKVRASSALPLIFPPLLEDGDVLIDGAMINNLPIDLMRQVTPEGQVIAVDVSAEKMMLSTYRFGPSISGWQVLRNRFVRPERRIHAPSIVDILWRVLQISATSSRYANSAYADLIIRPPVQQFAAQAFGDYETIVEIGYRTAQEQLAAWRV